MLRCAGISSGARLAETSAASYNNKSSADSSRPRRGFFRGASIPMFRHAVRVVVKAAEKRLRVRATPRLSHICRGQSKASINLEDRFTYSSSLRFSDVGMIRLGSCWKRSPPAGLELEPQLLMNMKYFNSNSIIYPSKLSVMEWYVQI